MKTILLILLLVVSAPHSSVDLLHKMHSRYHGHWHKTFHFIQETERYRNDSLIRSETWHEALSYPYNFRIDITEPANGNSYICNKDSSWRFKNGQLVNSSSHVNEFVFLLGGMYYYPFDSMLAHFTALGFATDKYHHSTWKGKPVYVLGADKDDEHSNQLWIDKEMLVPVRYLKYDDTSKEEAIFEGHIRLAGCWVETKAIFYSNGHLLQVEKYHDCVVNDSIDKRVFDPALFGKYYWYKK